MTGVVVDSCVMQHFAEALVSEKSNESHQLVRCLEEGAGFAVDEGAKMLSQWRETCGQMLIEDWITQGVQRGWIRMVTSRAVEQHKKYLRISLGFPYQQDFEGVYVEVAHSTEPHIIVTNDIDFWEPKAKGKNSAERVKFINGSKGRVCNYLRKSMNVKVLSVSQALEQLGCLDR